MRINKLKSTLIISLVFINSLMFVGIVSAVSTVSETNELAATINQNILTDYVQTKATHGGAFVAQGWDDDHVFADGTHPLFDAISNEETLYFGVENMLAIPALTRVFSVQGISAAQLIVNEQVIAGTITGGSNLIQKVNGIHGILHSSENSDEEIAMRITMEQFLTLDALSEYYKDTMDDAVFSHLSGMVEYEPRLRSTNPLSHGNNERVGGYWTAVTGPDGNKTGLFGGDGANDFCNTNTSLMAAAALSRYAMAIEKHSINDDGTEYSDAINQAETAMAFTEEYCYAKGFFKQFDGDTSDIVRLETQAFAIYAYALLYRVTGKGFYIFKADALLNRISESMWDAGRGGGMELYNVTSGTVVIENSVAAIKYGFSNAFLASACVELYKDTNDEKYMELTEEIMTFMYNTLYRVQDDIKGYCEWAYRNGSLTVPNVYAAKSLTSTSRWIKTNMLAMKVNAEVISANRPWYVKYLMYVIIGGLVLAAVIVVVVLVGRKASSGRALPKVVKGLLGDD